MMGAVENLIFATVDEVISTGPISEKTWLLRLTNFTSKVFNQGRLGWAIRKQHYLETFKTLDDLLKVGYDFYQSLSFYQKLENLITKLTDFENLDVSLTGLQKYLF